ncbi:hypothetical protein GCM10009639_51620 [Kitasatospora putterlickiae]|uniref:Uncharacterized protein n=1 Tax=Kitasatospora putterlickiae TaxID=221725 RepID=A0ABN1YD05_9ACTN
MRQVEEEEPEEEDMGIPWKGAPEREVSDRDPGSEDSPGAAQHVRSGYHRDHVSRSLSSARSSSALSGLGEGP